MSGEGVSFSHINLHVSEDGRTYCHAYDEAVPILVVDAGSSTLSITIRGRKADEAAVTFARALARDAQKFAAEVERLHAAQSDRDGKVPGRDAA